MIDSVKGTLNKYVDFSGRATRSEYWTFYLFYIISMFVSGFVGGLLGISALSNIVLLVLIIPLVACGARRMKGCYVYFEDKKTAEYFRKLIPLN